MHACARPQPFVERKPQSGPAYLLVCAGRTPIPPPLRSRFAAIEAQRAQEAALGERPLEEVVAPVAVPPVSCVRVCVCVCVRVSKCL